MIPRETDLIILRNDANNQEGTGSDRVVRFGAFKLRGDAPYELVWGAVGDAADSAKVEGMKYPVALVPTEEGYAVSCPGLPGCWSQGATEEEALANIRDAIGEYLEVAKRLVGEGNLREVEIPA